MIVYNSAAHAKQRQQVKPLSMEEIQAIVSCLNHTYIPESHTDIREALQRLIFDYENLCHIRAYMNKQPDNIEVNEPENVKP